MPPDSAVDPGSVAALLRTRRTSLLMDPDRPVPPPVLDQLLEAVTWAPCHKRTWPWRFAAFTGDGRRRLGDTCGDVLAAAGAEQHRVDKARTKYLRAPLVLVVGSVPDDDPVVAAENRDATAAGIQNLLLMAAALDLAAFWSSPYREATDQLNELCRFPSGSAIVGVIYLGWPSGSVAVPARPAPQLTSIDG